MNVPYNLPEYNQCLRMYERATLARSTRVGIHSIFVLRLSALGTGEVTSNNLNLRNLRYNEKSLSRDVGINKIGICSNTSNNPSKTVETTFLG